MSHLGTRSVAGRGLAPPPLLMLNPRVQAGTPPARTCVRDPVYLGFTHMSSPAWNSSSQITAAHQTHPGGVSRVPTRPATLKRSVSAERGALGMTPQCFGGTPMRTTALSDWCWLYTLPLLSSSYSSHKPSIPLAPGAGRLRTCKRPSPPEHLSYGPRGSSAPALAARAQSPGPAAGSSPPCGHEHSHAGVCCRSQRLWSRLLWATHSSFHSINPGDASALCSARRRLWDQGRDDCLHLPGARCCQQKGDFLRG